jgi:UPF0716 protein FxsA
MPIAALIALFILLPLAELYVIVEVVGNAIGPVWTIVLLAADSLLGAALMKSQGRAVWRQFNEALAQGRVPTREVLDGVLVIFGGAFLITPGFITDVVGLFLLLPPTRPVARRWLSKRLLDRANIRVARFGRGRRADNGDWDVEGTATEYDREAPRLRP